MELSIEENSHEKYDTLFEDHFIRETKNFYNSKCSAWLQESLPEYLIKVEGMLQREQKLCEECFPAHTLAKLEKLFDTEMLIAHQKTLLEREIGGFSSLLADMRKDDLKRMYSLFVRIEHGLKPLANQVCACQLTE
jgi:hypothetical protein